MEVDSPLREFRHLADAAADSQPRNRMPAQIFDQPRTDYTKALMAAAFDLKTAPAGVVSQ